MQFEGPYQQELVSLEPSVTLIHTGLDVYLDIIMRQSNHAMEL
jgi:hypothetical protein